MTWLPEIRWKLLHLAGRRPARRIGQDQRGNAVMIAAAAFPLLIGAAGLAVDGIEWVLQKREIQSAADGAAIAGVYGLIGSQDLNNAVNDSIVRAGGVAANANIQAIGSPPGHEADPFAVTVRIASAAQMTFSGVFLRKPFAMTAEATASVVENGKYCAFALGDMSDDSGVIIRPNTNVQMDCSITTNSSSPKAVQADSSSSLQADAVRAFGGIDDGGAIQNSHVRDHALAQKDPLEGTEPPLVPNTGCPTATINPGSREIVLEPGCYNNMVLNGNVRLQAGEYILNQGNFIVGPQGHVSCDDCTIFLTSETAATDPGSIGKVKMSSTATVRMTATREGPNSGILFYQDRHAAQDLPGDENRIGGNSFSRLEGLLYFPTQTIYLDANMSPDVQCTRMIARRLVFAGRVYVSKACDGLDKMTFAATEVRLIG
jgi:Flp pilus assembly protein TadG